MSETLPPTPQPAGAPDPDDATAPDLVDRVAANHGIRLAVLLGALGYLAVFAFWYFVLVMALTISIFLHEMGHYLVAKRNGMKVTEFFLGFGPRIWSFRRGETEYGVKLIWLGAYVKIIGMSNLEEVAPADEPRSYRSQPFLRRMPVVLAGPATNIALGFILMVVVFAGFGKTSDTDWQVDSVSPGSAASAAGIQEGDRLLAFDGQELDTWDEFRSLAQANAGTSVDLTVLRDGQEIELPVELGWGLTAATATTIGLEQGDRVTSLNGTELPLYADLVGGLKTAEGPVTIGYARIEDDGSTTEGTIEVTAPIELAADGSAGQLGVTRDQVTVHRSVPEAAGDSVSAFGTTITQSVSGMARVFSPSGIANLFDQVVSANDDEATETSPSTGTSSGSSSGVGSGVSEENLDRPSSIVGIVNIGVQLGQDAGWAPVLLLLATVNIFLGLINLLPLLPLDGGHIVVACYEEIRSRISHTTYRANMAKLMPITYVVVLLFLGLGLSTIYLDIADPISIR